MAIIVVGGHSRSVGKTSVVVGLIAALPERNWTAVKITQFGHGVCSRDGEPCDCAVADPKHSFAIQEELDRSGESDTSRFLVAGAMQSLWVRTRQGYLAEAMPSLRRKIESAEDVAIESNSIMKFIRPDLYITVLDYATPDFKQSAREFLDRADAVVLHEPAVAGLEIAPTWNDVSLKPIAGKARVFRVRPSQYVTDELVEFVRERIAKSKDRESEKPENLPSLPITHG
jgi:molybdopterin-guanine dinucleotide biosynthesis protein